VLAPLRIATAIVSASAAIAMLLSILCLYGALDDAARRRSRELAVRIARGARRRYLIAQVLREAGSLALAGSSAGLLAVAVRTRLLAGIVPSNAPFVRVWLAGPRAGRGGRPRMHPARTACVAGRSAAHHARQQLTRLGETLAISA